ncbi:MAG: Uma2 family endonuclease [Methylococcaceae bacterium]|nr:Uma2 family endonuclease [Methylococcaceae bacterium]
MSLKYAHDKISVEEYLRGELLAESKHEYIDGDVFAMAGANENHNLLSGNFATELKNQLTGKPYKTFMSDMKVKVEESFFYPDVMVVCQEDNANDYYKTAPVIIVEVLSDATRRFDKTHKLSAYQQIPTLEEYVLIEQSFSEIQVFSRQNHWQSSYYYLGDSITFASLNVNVTVEDIYYQVNNADVTAFLQNQAQQLAN